MCSKIAAYFMDIVNSTMHFLVGQMNQLPVIERTEDNEKIEFIVKNNVTLSKADWDSFETSWDFKRNPLV